MKKSTTKWKQNLKDWKVKCKKKQILKASLMMRIERDSKKKESWWGIKTLKIFRFRIINIFWKIWTTEFTKSSLRFFISYFYLIGEFHHKGLSVFFLKWLSYIFIFTLRYERGRTTRQSNPIIISWHILFHIFRLFVLLLNFFRPN